MKVVVFGANGGVGRQLLALALAQGHEVTAAVRDPANIRCAHHRLLVRTCDVRDGSAVRQTLRGQEAVLCALGGGRRGVTVYAAGAQTIIAGMKEEGIRRIVFLSNFGVLGEQGEGWVSAALVTLAKAVLRATLRDHAAALYILRHSGLQWSAVRPMALTDGPWTGRYRVTRDGLPAGGRRISRADVADLMLRCATSDDYLGQVPGVAY